MELHDRKGEKLTVKFGVRVKYDDVSVGEGHYNVMQHNSVY